MVWGHLINFFVPREGEHLINFLSRAKGSIFYLTIIMMTWHDDVAMFYFGQIFFFQVSIYTRLDWFVHWMARKYGWTWTLNNYTESDVLHMKGCIGKRGISYVCFGREVGEKGTPHLQGYLQSTQKQLTRLVLAFEGAKPHLEKQKGDTGPTEAETKREGGEPWTAVGYCMKDGDFYEAGVKEDLKPLKMGQRTDLEGALKAVNEGKSDYEMFLTHTDTMFRFNKAIERYRQLKQENEALIALREEYGGLSLWKWQGALAAVYDTTPDPRKIMWIWSEEGNLGKSAMASWLVAMKDACLLEPSKKADMALVFSQNPKPIVVFDCTRATEKGAIGPAYSLAETLKNGTIFSAKYNSRTVHFKKPHVIFFANFQPDPTVWSPDRYTITKLDQTSLK